MNPKTIKNSHILKNCKTNLTRSKNPETINSLLVVKMILNTDDKSEKPNISQAHTSCYKPDRIAQRVSPSCVPYVYLIQAH